MNISNHRGFDVALVNDISCFGELNYTYRTCTNTWVRETEQVHLWRQCVTWGGRVKEDLVLCISQRRTAPYHYTVEIHLGIMPNAADLSQWQGDIRDLISKHGLTSLVLRGGMRTRGEYDTKLCLHSLRGFTSQVRAVYHFEKLTHLQFKWYCQMKDTIEAQQNQAKT